MPSKAQNFCENHMTMNRTIACYIAQWYTCVIYCKDFNCWYDLRILVYTKQEKEVYRATDNRHMKFSLVCVFCVFYHSRRVLCPISFCYWGSQYSYFQRYVVLLRGGVITRLYDHIQKSRNHFQYFIPIFFNPKKTKIHRLPFKHYIRMVKASTLTSARLFLKSRLHHSLAMWLWPNYLTSLSFRFLITNMEIIMPHLQGVWETNDIINVNIPNHT